jgi:hypothetical protein
LFPVSFHAIPIHDNFSVYDAKTKRQSFQLPKPSGNCARMRQVPTLSVSGRGRLTAIPTITSVVAIARLIFVIT